MDTRHDARMRYGLFGVHGGAGVTSLCRAGLWKVAFDTKPSVVGYENTIVVCRSHASGLAAAAQYAASMLRDKTPAVLGLIVVADAPKLTGWLRSERAVVEAAYARHWHVPWMEEWRHSAAGELPAPPVLADLIAELSA